MQPDWQDLFSSHKSSASEKIRWRVLRKRGEALLVLPENRAAALASLALYPAQSGKARLWLLFLWWALRLNLTFFLESAEVSVAASAPLNHYLARQAGQKQFPQFAIFCGNPRTAGRRFIVLLFGEQNRPARVVKMGIGGNATNLIEREMKFLESAPACIAGIPKSFDSFNDGHAAGFAMEFFTGDFPAAADEEIVSKILNAWVQDSRVITLAEFKPWLDLESECREHPLMKRLSTMRSIPMTAVIWHGDLAPWNMKLNRGTGRCVVFDWERGELAGLPGWDWFHFVLQPALLVEKLSPVQLRERLENLLRSPEFLAYAKRCGIDGRERALLLGYLLFNIEVLKPSEGRDTTRALLELLENSWTSDLKS